MPYTEAAKNAMLDGTYSPPTHVAAFDGDPTDGGEELDRVAISWSAATGGAKEQSANPQFDIDAGKTVDYIGYYTASEDGTLLFYDEVDPESFTNAGTYTLTSSEHDLNNDPS